MTQNHNHHFVHSHIIFTNQSFTSVQSLIAISKIYLEHYLLKICQLKCNFRQVMIDESKIRFFSTEDQCLTWNTIKIDALIYRLEYKVAALSFYGLVRFKQFKQDFLCPLYYQVRVSRKNTHSKMLRPRNLTPDYHYVVKGR